MAAVAIPSFNGFQKRARDSEAKTNLGSLYTAEKGYFYEKDEYSNALSDIGFLTESGSDRYFTIGFTGTISTNWYANTVGTVATGLGFAANKAANCKVNNLATPKEFKAGAFGDSNSVGANYQMTQAKDLDRAGANDCQ